MKFIKNPYQFFIMSDFNFSLFGAIFGFLIVTYILLRLEKGRLRRYIDGIVLAFFFILTVGYLGAFFGGQVYGRETYTGLEILYTHAFSPVPYQVPVFPLPLMYMWLSFLLFCALYILSLFIHIRGYIGFLGIILFSVMILMWETLSGKQDILSVVSVFNLPQVFALVLALWWSYNFYTIFRENKNNTSLHS